MSRVLCTRGYLKPLETHIMLLGDWSFTALKAGSGGSAPVSPPHSPCVLGVDPLAASAKGAGSGSAVPAAQGM